MPAIDATSIGTSGLLELLQRSRSVAVAPATDVASAIELLVGIHSSDSVTAKIKPGGPGYLQNWASATRDPWLIETMSTIKGFRLARDGWDGDSAAAPVRSHINAAEMLASFLAKVPERLRPVLSIDAEGRPTYAANTGDFYLHLTIDSASSLTWFAELNGQEYFEDDVLFSGRRMPEKLEELFATAAA